MDLRLKDKNAASPKNDFDPDPLHQILNVAAPAIVQTLAFNLKKINRDNFSRERSTQSIVYRRFASELDVTSRDIVSLRNPWENYRDSTTLKTASIILVFKRPAKAPGLWF